MILLIGTLAFSVIFVKFAIDTEREIKDERATHEV